MSNEMKLKMYQFKLKTHRNLVTFWYWLMKPIAYFFSTEKRNRRYNKKKSKITEDQAIKWIAEDIAKYMIRNKSDKEFSFIVADYMSENDFSGYYSIKNLDNYVLRTPKAKMAYYKFNKDIVFQEKVFQSLKQYNMFCFEEEVEMFSGWKKIKDYQKTYHISLKKRKN